MQNKAYKHVIYFAYYTILYYRLCSATAMKSSIAKWVFNLWDVWLQAT